MSKSFSFFSLFFLSINLFGQSTPIAIRPFTLEKSSIYFYCQVNGSDSLKFLFDTGADGSVINENSIGKVSLKIDGESLNIGSNGSNVVKSSSNNTLASGNFIRKQVQLTVIPYQTTAFDGVFGTDLMNGNIIEIDYEKKQLRFYDPSTYKNELTAYSKNKIYFPGHYLSIKGALKIKGKLYKGFFGLDTGADDLLVISSPFSKKNGLATKTQHIGSSVSQGSDGSIYESPTVIIPEIKFGELSFYRLYVDLSTATQGGNAATDKAGFFGNDFLKRFNIVLDMKNAYIYFKPNHNLYTKFYGEN